MVEYLHRISSENLQQTLKKIGENTSDFLVVATREWLQRKIRMFRISKSPEDYDTAFNSVVRTQAGFSVLFGCTFQPPGPEFALTGSLG